MFALISGCVLIFALIYVPFKAFTAIIQSKKKPVSHEKVSNKLTKSLNSKVVPTIDESFLTDELAAGLQKEILAFKAK